jgi:hypothetical protein
VPPYSSSGLQESLGSFVGSVFRLSTFQLQVVADRSTTGKLKDLARVLPEDLRSTTYVFSVTHPSSGSIHR